MNRSDFIKRSLAAVILSGVTPACAVAKPAQDPAAMATELVKEFVVAGHKNLPLVKEMLLEYPNLIYAKYDWGNSDFEEAIEGAGHLGNKEIANYLISQGARVNLFVLTMLGKTDLVMPTLEAYPELVFAKGPHGFTLLHHANVGENKIMQEYLKAKGLEENNIPIK